jgi:hypothetical protein
MSFSILFFVVACMGMYKLGNFNARHPGEFWHNVRWAVQRLWKWMNQ